MGYATGSDQQDYWRRAVGDVTRARLERDVPELVRLLGAPRALVGDKGHLLPDVRDYALRALRKVGDERAVPALTRMLLDDPQESARMGAARALGAIGDRRAIPALLETLGDGAELVRTLRRFELRTLVREGVEGLQEPGVVLRLWALESLAKLGAKQVLPVLGALLHHDDRHYRYYAADLVEQLGDPEGIDLLRRAEVKEPLWRRGRFRAARRRLEVRERLEMTPFDHT